MDIKIGLLVKNRISVQDVLSTSQQVKHKDKKNQRHSQILEQGPGSGVGGLSKANHEKIEVRTHLYFQDSRFTNHSSGFCSMYWTLMPLLHVSCSSYDTDHFFLPS